MAKKFSQFDVAASIAGDESFVGLKDGDNAQFPFADILSYFQSEIDDDFWPLSGAADITGTVTLNGNDFDLIFGSPNSLDEFDVFANNNIYFEVDDGVDGSYFDFSPTSAEVYANDGSSNSQIYLYGTGIDIVESDGVDTSSFEIAPNSFYGSVFDSGNTGSLVFDYIDGDSNYASLQFGSGVGVYYDDDGLFSNDSFAVVGILDSSFNAYSIELAIDRVGLVQRDSATDVVAAFYIEGGVIKTTGSVVFADPSQLPIYTVATLPVPATAGLLAFCSDDGGGQVPVFSDNAGNWRRVTDGNIAAV